MIFSLLNMSLAWDCYVIIGFDRNQSKTKKLKLKLTTPSSLFESEGNKFHFSSFLSGDKF